MLTFHVLHTDIVLQISLLTAICGEHNRETEEFKIISKQPSTEPNAIDTTATTITFAFPDLLSFLVVRGEYIPLVISVA